MHSPSSARGQSATNTGLSVTKGEQGHLQHNNRAGQVVGRDRLFLTVSTVAMMS